MSADLPDIDPPHVHGRRGGLPVWLEWATSVSALVISVSSIFIAVHNSHDADKALKAQTYPYLDQDHSDATPTGERVLSVGFVNNGVGPAHEQSFRIKAHGRYFTSFDALIADAVGSADLKTVHEALHPLMNRMPTRFIPANTNRFVFETKLTDANAAWWNKVKDASDRWVMEVCYCSVFQECWTRVDTDPPQPAKACKRDEATEFNP
jgi:hypothetical protein